MKQSEKLGEIESVKAVSDFFSPASGKVVEVNHNAVDETHLVNEDPYGEGWLLKLELSNPAELETARADDAREKKCRGFVHDAARILEGVLDVG